MSNGGDGSGGDSGPGGDSGGLGGDSGGLGGDSGGIGGGEGGEGEGEGEGFGESIGQSALSTQADAQAAMSSLGYGQVGLGQVGQAVGTDTGSFGYGFGNIGGFGFGPSIGINGFGVSGETGNMSVGIPGVNLGFNESFGIPGVNLGYSTVGTLSQAAINNQAQQDAVNAIAVAANPGLSFSTPPGIPASFATPPTSIDAELGISTSIPSNINVNQQGLFGIAPQATIPGVALGPQIATTATDLSEMAVPALPAVPTVTQMPTEMPQAIAHDPTIPTVTIETPPNPVVAAPLPEATVEGQSGTGGHTGTGNISGSSGLAGSGAASIGSSIAGALGISSAQAANAPSLAGFSSPSGPYGGVSGMPGEGSTSAVGSQGGGFGTSGGIAGGAGAGGQIGNPNQIGIDPTIAVALEAQQRGLTLPPPTGYPAAPQIPTIPVTMDPNMVVPTFAKGPLGIQNPNPTDLGYPALAKGNNLAVNPPPPTIPVTMDPNIVTVPQNLPLAKADKAAPPPPTIPVTMDPNMVAPPIAIPPTLPPQTKDVAPPLIAPPIPTIPVTMDPNMVAPPTPPPPPVAVPVPTQKEMDKAKEELAKALPQPVAVPVPTQKELDKAKETLAKNLPQEPKTPPITNPPLPIARPAPPPPPKAVVPVVVPKDTPLTKETLKDIQKQIETHPLVPSKGKSAPTGKGATGKGTLGTGITGFVPGQNLGQYGRGAQNQMSTPPPGVASTAGQAMQSLYGTPISSIQTPQVFASTTQIPSQTAAPLRGTLDYNTLEQRTTPEFTNTIKELDQQMKDAPLETQKAWEKSRDFYIQQQIRDQNQERPVTPPPRQIEAV